MRSRRGRRTGSSGWERRSGAMLNRPWIGRRHVGPSASSSSGGQWVAGPFCKRPSTRGTVSSSSASFSSRPL
ncbi:hypothetical protein ACFPRL_00885 [Pseudoclavibacter helvolus]